MSAPPLSEITLRALQGEPLADAKIRTMVEATANAIAERQGVKVVQLKTGSDFITVRLQTGRIEAIGFAMELRRLTTRWYTQKYGERTLWGEPIDEGDEWKRGTA